MTLEELSQKLNVSTSTISRALSRPDLVSRLTRERVLSAVKEYNYRPNRIARSLRKRRTQLVGIIVSDIQNPFYAAVVRAVEGVLTHNGYTLLIFNANESPETEIQALHLLGEMQVAGIIHASTGANVEMLKELCAQDVPIIDIDRVSGLDEADLVMVNNQLGAQMAAHHLLGLGHDRLAVISGPLHLTPGLERLEGFRHALAEDNIPLPEDYIELGDFREHSGYAAAQRLLALSEPPTALFVANNEMMAGALAAVRERNVAIPRELSLISFDDVRWAKYVEPPLTVIAQPTREIGLQAAELLFERFSGRTQQVQRILDPALVIRGSCAAPCSVSRQLLYPTERGGGG